MLRVILRGGLVSQLLCGLSLCKVLGSGLISHLLRLLLRAKSSQSGLLPKLLACQLLCKALLLCCILRLLCGKGLLEILALRLVDRPLGLLTHAKGRHLRFLSKLTGLQTLLERLLLRHVGG